MSAFYTYYAVDWTCSTIEDQIRDLLNFDIIYHDNIAGAILLAFNSDGCYVRDLQVTSRYQNKGVGIAAIAVCERLLIERGLNFFILQVFKFIRAYPLYQ